VASPCILEASLIITLTAADSLSILDGNARYEWYITPIVRGELTRPENRKPVDAMIGSGRLRITEIDTEDLNELAEWARWTDRVDAGEAEAIAIAVSRSWMIAIEDRQAQRAVTGKLGLGRWINSANLLLDAVADGRLALADADQVFASLDCYTGYVKRGVLSLARLPRN